MSPVVKSTSRRRQRSLQEGHSARLCYLLAFPDPTPEDYEMKTIPALKEVPYFQPVDIRWRKLGEEEIEFEGTAVKIIRQRYEGGIQIAECYFSIESPLSAEGFRKRLQVEDAIQRYVLRDPQALFEEYSILLLQKIASPDAFVEQYAPLLARFIRAQKEHLDKEDIEDTLITRVRYSENDLSIVDWEGAILIAREDDFEPDIELLKIGNYQLLRYRLLDQGVENALRRLGEEFSQPRMNWLQLGRIRSAIRRILHYRLELMLEFERTEQNLLLIGDWYTSKLYRGIREELYLDEWKETVRTKLDNLEHILATIQANFSLSWQDLLETVQITGWLILLLGYFILFFLESGLWKH